MLINKFMPAPVKLLEMPSRDARHIGGTQLVRAASVRARPAAPAGGLSAICYQLSLPCVLVC